MTSALRKRTLQLHRLRVLGTLDLPQQFKLKDGTQHVGMKLTDLDTPPTINFESMLALTTS